MPRHPRATPLDLRQRPSASVADRHERPLALLDGHTVVSVNAAARSLGVQPGFKRATALSLAPQLTFGLADPVREAHALAAVAHVALACTPAVSIQPPSQAQPDVATHTVLLEVQASLRYFGGLGKLLQRLRGALDPLGHRLHLASAATPLAAALLARVHPVIHCADLAATRTALALAPVWLLGPGQAHWEALQGMGLRTIADVQQVPRDGLARRFGPVVLDELDRATGHRPDPREPIRPPAVFESRLELFARADTTDQLLHGAGVLLARLVAWLSAQHAHVRRFTLAMAHERRSRHDTAAAGTTTLEVALAEPSRDGGHLLALLRERLAQLQLPAPTLDLSLHAADIARRPPPNNELFPTPASQEEGLTRLVERLQARLGREQVLRLAVRDDHRPECATEWRPADARMRPGHGSQGATAAPWSSRGARPVWLADQPQPLPERDHAPVLDGQPLRCLSGPERIESGWWDATLVERDYYIAQAQDGALVWIFTRRVGQERMWFLQGRFG